jgi:hypothetical protein
VHAIMMVLVYTRKLVKAAPNFYITKITSKFILEKQIYSYSKFLVKAQQTLLNGLNYSAIPVSSQNKEIMTRSQQSERMP